MLGGILDDLLISPSTGSCITATRHFAARAPVLAPFPASLDPRLLEALRARGIEQLYSHQARTCELVAKGQHVVVVTPTASGKTLCYNLPVLQTLVDQPDGSAAGTIVHLRVLPGAIGQYRRLVDRVGA